LAKILFAQGLFAPGQSANSLIESECGLRECDRVQISPRGRLGVGQPSTSAQIPGIFIL
jgi:hypothetical protein